MNQEPVDRGETESRASTPSGAERREYARYATEGWMRLQVLGDERAEARRSRVLNISATGVLIESQPLSPGTQVLMKIESDLDVLPLRGTVIRCDEVDSGGLCSLAIRFGRGEQDLATLGDWLDDEIARAEVFAPHRDSTLGTCAPPARWYPDDPVAVPTLELWTMLDRGGASTVAELEAAYPGNRTLARIAIARLLQEGAVAETGRAEAELVPRASGPGPRVGLHFPVATLYRAALGGALVLTLWFEFVQPRIAGAANVPVVSDSEVVSLAASPARRPLLGERR